MLNNIEIKKILMLNILILFLFFLILFFRTGYGNQQTISDETTATVRKGGLEITTSGDKGSNAVQSFIVVGKEVTVPQGIKDDAEVSNLTEQIPFEVKLKNELTDEDTLKWKITVPKDEYGKIKTDLNGYALTETTPKPTKGYEWTTTALDKEVENRHILKFRPIYPEHKPEKYKRGKDGNGGGTTNIDQKDRNPRLTYSVSVEIANGATTIKEGPEEIKMDNTDMIRQEYVNHYGRESSYKSGSTGNVNAPKRDEIEKRPARPSEFVGRQLTVSKYKLMVNDGMVDFAKKVAKAFEDQRSIYNTEGSRLEYLEIEQPADPGGEQQNNDSDTGQQPDTSEEQQPNYVDIPKSKLWITSGWRGPEQNEWVSRAINSVHQLGGALDIAPNETVGTKEAAIIYWVLWVGAENGNLTGFWQLENKDAIAIIKSSSSQAEKNTAITTDESPENEDGSKGNGIPDVFENSRHLHIDIKER